MVGESFSKKIKKMINFCLTNKFMMLPEWVETNINLYNGLLGNEKMYNLGFTRCNNITV